MSSPEGLLSSLIGDDARVIFARAGGLVTDRDVEEEAVIPTDTSNRTPGDRQYRG
jgi:hypothetical protein